MTGICENDRSSTLVDMCMTIISRLCKEPHENSDGDPWSDLEYKYSKGKLIVREVRFCDGPVRGYVYWEDNPVFLYDVYDAAETIEVYVPGTWEERIQRVYNATIKRRKMQWDSMFGSSETMIL